MIRIHRLPADAACAVLNRTDKHGISERDYALWHFGNIAPQVVPLPVRPVKTPKFSAYRKQPVKDALTDMFGSKCAYCESHYAHVASMDVEHYRPKAGYLGEGGVMCKPGYYWLAADWNNLLPSCNDCNRERKQYRRSSDGKRVPTKSGKANQFPLAPGSPRATQPTEVDQEMPLLLNPCIDIPEAHLRFLAAGFVEPAHTPEEAVLPKGRKTIEVCGLDRDLLVSRRREWAIQIKGAMQGVLTADYNVRRYPADAEFARQLTLAETTLAGYYNASGSYRALSQAIETAFIHVRRLAADYFAAEAAWTANSSNINRNAVKARAAEIYALLRSPDFDKTLVIELIQLARVPLPS